MKNFKSLSTLSVVLLVFVMSCSSDDDYVQIPEESYLEQLIVDLYGTTDALILPLSTDLNSIPSAAIKRLESKN